MKKLNSLMVILGVFMVAACVSPPDQGVSSASIARGLTGSVFEVVIKKPYDTPDTVSIKQDSGREDEIIEDPMVYEEELPWSLTDYTIRTDEYLPVGTAFAISTDRLLTAAHVLNLENISYWSEYYIRDIDGNVYPVNNIYKYSNERDFVEFDVSGSVTFTPLQLQNNYAINHQVFSVGNALGEGIITRDGTLTSVTKESNKGEWEYLRFTAAASPGNSGGPLLDTHGEVLGIIVKKSANENLNYAIPISEVVNWDEGKGLYYENVQYSLRIIDDVYGPLEVSKDFTLPMMYTELRGEIFQYTHNRNNEYAQALLEQEKDHLFPFSDGAQSVLFVLSSNAFSFPHMFVENKSDFKWGAYRPEEIEDVQLENNGFFKYGSMLDYSLIRYRKPDNVSISELYSDTAAFGEKFINGFGFTRTIAGKKIRINSMGEASEQKTLTDAYGRKWVKMVWDIPFGDSQLIAYTIPVPSGYVGIAVIDSLANSQNFQFVDMEVYLDYITFSYYGTLEEWQNFMSEEYDEYRPDFFKDYSLESDLDTMFSFTTPQFSLNLTDELFDIQNESSFFLKIGYELGDNKASIIPVGASINENRNTDEYYAFTRIDRPHPSLPDGKQQDWKQVVEGEAPHNREVVTDNGKCYLFTLKEEFLDKDMDTPFIVTIGLGKRGSLPQDQMEESLNLFESFLEITP